MIDLHYNDIIKIIDWMKTFSSFTPFFETIDDNMFLLGYRQRNGEYRIEWYNY